MEKSIILCDTNILIEIITWSIKIKKKLKLSKKDIEHLILMNINDLISQKFIELMLKYTKSL